MNTKSTCNRIRKGAFLLPILLLGFLLVSQTVLMAAGARESSVYIDIRPDHEDGLYAVGEAITFRVWAFEAVPVGVGSARKKKDATIVPGCKLRYVIQGDGGLLEKGELLSGEEAVTVQTRLDRPGFVLCTVQEDGMRDWQHKGIGGAGVEPHRIKAGVAMPDDFQAFWKKEIEALQRTPIKVHYREKVEHKWDTFDRYKIKISGPGHPKNGLNPYVCGYLGIPRDARPRAHPAVVSFPGAGVRNPSPPKEFIQKLGFIGLGIEIHGFEADQEKSFYRGEARKALENLPVNDGATEEESLALNYERIKILRALQALRYLKQQPEWDGRILATWGGSQGGGLALIAGSLDPDVTAIMACYPGYCDQFGHVLNQNGGWPDMLTRKAGNVRRRHGRPMFPFAEQTAPYFDAVNFARTLQGKDIAMTTGWIDTVCPPTSVYAAYNQIPETIHKELFYGVATGHHQPKWDPKAFVRKHMERRVAE